MGHNARYTSLLVVDDSDTFLSTVRHYFEKKGMTVYTSKSVSEACMMIGDHPDIDLVFLDFHLAGINNGTEILEKFRKYSLNHISVYACSGSTEENRILLDLGCDGIVGKDLRDMKKIIF